MRLDRRWIAAHIPHRGSMVLLDEVIRWDAQRISCRSTTHRDLDHPLRAHGRLGIASGVEYAAQTMAVHGALAAGALAAGARAAASANAPASAPLTPAAGFLAGLRAVQMHAMRLDDVPGDLICNAVRVAGDQVSALYEFDLHCDAGPLLSGRATVVLDSAARLHPVGRIHD